MTTVPQDPPVSIPFFARRMHRDAAGNIKRGEARQHVIIASWWFVALLNRFAKARRTKEEQLAGAVPAINVYALEDQIPVYRHWCPFFTYRVLRRG